MIRLRRFVLVLLLSFACLERSSYAYLDPGTGSLISQIILGGVAGLALALKLFWHRLSGFLRPRGSRANPQGDVQEQATQRQTDTGP